MSQNTQTFFCYLINKKYPQRLLSSHLVGDNTLNYYKKKIIGYFSKSFREPIADIRLVRKGPPEDDVDDTISDDYFDDKNIDKTVFDLMKLIEEKGIYKEEDGIFRIYFRTVSLKINIKIIDLKSTQFISFLLSYQNNTYSKLIINIQEKIRQQIESPIYIFQDNENLDKISEDADMKQYHQTGLILFLFPIKIKFIDIETNKKTKILIESNDYLSTFLPTIFDKLLIKGDPKRFLYQIKNDEKQKVDIHCPILKILRNQKKEPITIEIIPNKAEILNSDFYIDVEEESEKYKTMGLIYEGKNSILYKIIEKETLKPFCKKILIGETLEFKDAQNAVKEFEILHLLDHPCICHAFYINTHEELEDEKTTIAVIFEFIDFKLSDYLASKLVSDTLKTRIVVEICHAMKYLHSKNFIYRDLNIDNIMLDLNMNVKLINFGFAHMIEMLQGEEEISIYSMTKNVGSDAFMSPEMSNDDDNYNSKTDVYSFGVVVYFIFVGKLPNQSFKEKMERKPVKLPMESTSISSICIDLLSRCLSINPKDRPSFNEILEFLRANKFMLSSDIDPTIISKRDKELESIES